MCIYPEYYGTILYTIGLADDYRFVGPAIDAMNAAAAYRRRIEAVGHVFQVSKSWYFSHCPETVELAAGHRAAHRV